MTSRSFQLASESRFRKIDEDLEFLFSAAREVLEDIGQGKAARLLQVPPVVPEHPLSRTEVQALSLAFQLLNLVEESIANQTIQSRESEQGLAAEPGLWGHWLQRLEAAGVSRDRFARVLDEVAVEPVLTGHPTEARRWSVLDLQRRLSELMEERDAPWITPRERVSNRAAIQGVLELLWRTGEILLNKPLVENERDNIAHYLTEKFPAALELADRHFLEAARQAGYAVERDGLPLLPRVRLGNWVGGDRDGHPFVTARFTESTLEDFRARALDVLSERLASLRRSMVLSVFAQEPSEELAAIVAKVPGQRASEEPWGAFVDRMRERLPGRSGRDDAYRSPDELRDDLVRLERYLNELGARRIAALYVRPEIRYVETFGFHLAALDIRQNSAFHERALTQLLEAAGVPEGESFVDWSEDRKIAFLRAELLQQRPFGRPGERPGPEAEETIASLEVVASHMRRFGRRAIGSLIISMTHSVSDLLVAYALCREAGLTRSTDRGPVCLLRITPLFETLDDLERSGSILAEFADLPMTVASLPWLDRELDDELYSRVEAEAGCQPFLEVMLGYSDSSKDGGILASQWAVRETQSRLLELGRRRGLGVRFFHGRGGTVGRGAGPTHRFLEALPAGALLHGARTTEQGEVIAQKYNNHRTAAHHVELLVAGSVGAALLAECREDPESLRAALGTLANSSRRAYEDLLSSDGFVEFYREVTPIDALEKSHIGSRPSRRAGRASLQDLRAIPWVFSWNQSRFFLPGWFGVGSALRDLKGSDPALYRELGERWSEWPFLRYLLYNIESSVESASAEWMGAYGELVSDSAARQTFLDRILAEYELTREHVEELMGSPLRIRRPRFFKTLHHRDAWLALLHGEQIRRIRQWRSTLDAEDLLHVLQSINAIAAGLRTTG